MKSNKLFRFSVLCNGLIVGIFLLSIASQSMATDVGGQIITDTTWNLAGSPYNITENVQIAEGVTLTIEPGVVVNGNDNSFEVWGYLNAIGTDTSNITLNNVRTAERAITTTINIQFSTINSGEYIFCQYDSSFSLLDSKIQNTNRIDIINTCSNDAFMERNIFIGVGRISIEGDEPNNVYIKNNVFYQTGSLLIYQDNIIVEYNSFLSTDRTALQLSTRSHNFTAINNFWNTINTSVIDSMIWDGNDDFNIPSYVEYIPFRTEPHPNTPILDFNQAPIAEAGADKVVYDWVTLNGSASYDPDGSIVTYEWSLQHEDGSIITASGPNPTISDLLPGYFDVYLTVTDDGGLVDTDNMLLSVAGSCPISPVSDEDEDGKPDLTDICPNTLLDSDVDNNGCSLEQFCSSIDTSSHHGRRICRRSDWENDEPLKNKGDCKAVKQGRGSHNYQCVPR